MSLLEFLSSSSSQGELARPDPGSVVPSGGWCAPGGGEFTHAFIPLSPEAGKTIRVPAVPSRARTRPRSRT